MTWTCIPTSGKRSTSPIVGGGRRLVTHVKSSSSIICYCTASGTPHLIPYQIFRQSLVACHFFRALEFSGTVTILPPMTCNHRWCFCPSSSSISGVVAVLMLHKPKLEKCFWLLQSLQLSGINPSELRSFLYPKQESPNTSPYSLLKSLRLRMGRVTEGVIIEFAAGCPLVNHFSLRQCDHSNALRALIVDLNSTDAGIRWPYLDTMTLHKTELTKEWDVN